MIKVSGLIFNQSKYVEGKQTLKSKIVGENYLLRAVYGSVFTGKNVI